MARGWALPTATTVALLRQSMLATGLSKFALEGFPAVTPGGEKPYVHEQDNEMAAQVAPIAQLLVCASGNEEDGVASSKELLAYFERTGRLAASTDLDAFFAGL